ncbi:MAG: sulfatase-like hydrolase/transferase, partial [Planctomycetota bacterium]
AEPDDPWLAIWSASAVHSKWEWPIGEFDDLHDQGDEPAQADGWIRYNATIEALDAEIGELRAALDQGLESTIWDETLVIVVGDNGSDRVPLQVAQAQGVDIGDYELTHFKGSTHFEGTSIPLIVTGPDSLVTRRGEAEGALVDIVDLMDTIREVAGLPTSVYGGRLIDSQSFLPWLSGVHPTPREHSLAMFFAPNGVFPPVAAGSAVRLGYARWIGTDLYRLVRGEVGAGVDQLFQLADALGPVDPLEKTPLDITQGTGLAAYQAVVTELDLLLATPDSCP